MKRKQVVFTPKTKEKKRRSREVTSACPELSTLATKVLIPVLAVAIAFLAYQYAWPLLSAGELYERPADANSPKGTDHNAHRKRTDTQLLVSELEARQARGADSFPSYEDIFTEQHKNELLWGTYRPHLYYGMRTRVGLDSLVFGMMWYEPAQSPFRIQLRHVSKSEDGVDFQWIHHNGKNYGVQRVNDTKLGVELTTTFLKTPGENGGDWVVRISGRQLPSAANAQPKQTADGKETTDKVPKISLIFYLGIENQQTGTIQLDASNPPMNAPLIGTVSLSGKTSSTGDYSMAFHEGKKSQKGSYFSGINLKEVWQIEKNLRLILPKGSRRAQLENIIHPDSSVYVLQKFKTVPFQMEVSFISQAKKRYPSSSELLSAHSDLISTDNFDDKVELESLKFEQRFEDTFHLRSKGFTADQLGFARTALSNLIGGTGYFYGYNRIYEEPTRPASPHEPPQQNWKLSEKPRSLFTATPSRSFFPRGFLWDEGFHQLIISNWDKDLSKDMLWHWMQLITKDGWLPREQILGAEAESRVPTEFIVQYPDNANPPTLYFPIEGIIDRGGLTKSDLNFLKVAYHQFSQNYVWYMKSQKGPMRNTFRWRGAKGNHTLPSGLDDYPRAFDRSDLEEHIDLLSWMIMSSNVIDKIAQSIDMYDVQQYKQIEEELIQTLHERHWHDKAHAFCDFDGLKNKHVEHLGYVSLFPLLFGLVPLDSPRLSYLLELMENDKLLKSNFGLRSLSRSDPLFGTNENYWRGPVWININYLTLRALHRYYIAADGPYKDRAVTLYSTLRKSLITNMFKVYRRNGDIYENYNALTGAGQGQHPFAGWSSLILLIMAEVY